ncbi:MAG: cupin domain-containing protein [Pyrinomonadaceae bacterium]
MEVIVMKTFGAKGAIRLVLILVGGIGVIYGIGAKPLAATFTPTTELKWHQSPIPGGVTISPVAGEIMKGEHVTYVRFPAGTKIPMHVHSTDYIGIVISGNMRHPVKGKPSTDVQLPPGSHWSIPAGLEHQTECLEGLECVAVMIQKDHFDYELTTSK